MLTAVGCTDGVLPFVATFAHSGIGHTVCQAAAVVAVESTLIATHAQAPTAYKLSRCVFESTLIAPHAQVPPQH